MRALNTAEIAYAQAHRGSGYTCSFSELSRTWGIGEDLAKGKKNGYVFELHDCTTAKAAGPIVRYRLVAYPAVPGKKETPAYCSDESDVIRVAQAGLAEDCLKTGIDWSEIDSARPKTYSQSSEH